MKFFLPAMLALLGGGCKQSVALNDAGCPGELVPHDHQPQHGGQVGMVGDFHLEVADTGSAIRVFFTDVCRSPLPPPASGVLVLEGEGGTGAPIERVLRPVGKSHLEAPRDGVEIPFLATIKARVGPHPTEMSFLIFEEPGATP